MKSPKPKPTRNQAKLAAWALNQNTHGDPAAQHLLAHICLHARKFRGSWVAHPSQATLAAAIGCSRYTIIRKLVVLTQLGLIARIPRRRSNGQTTTDFIYIHVPVDESSATVTRDGVVVWGAFDGVPK